MYIDYSLCEENCFKSFLAVPMLLGLILCALDSSASIGFVEATYISFRPVGGLGRCFFTRKLQHCEVTRSTVGAGILSAPGHG